MCAIPGFIAPARMWEVEAEEESADTTTIVAQYGLRSMEDMRRYFAEHAPRMRGGLPEVFRKEAKFARRVLRVI